MSADAPLFGLVLAGGASTRMQRDKAAINYHGESQLQWTFHLLSHVCAATFVSVRPDQREEPNRAASPQIVDRLPGIGPIAGISAALQAHPKAAWLVVACDLPFLNETTLRHLVANRDPRKLATAYRSHHDALPEPLCAIWEPASREPLLAYVAAGKQCPRKFLINADTLLLDLPDARALDNVNTADEYRATLAEIGTGRPAAAIAAIASDAHAHSDEMPDASAAIASGHTHVNAAAVTSATATIPSGHAHNAKQNASAATAPSAGARADAPKLLDSVPAVSLDHPFGSLRAGGHGHNIGAVAETRSADAGQTSVKARTLRVQYYAILREQAGRSEETLDTAAATPAELYDELRRRHPFQLTSSQLKVALNNEFSDWHTPLRHGDTVVFIPPVAGG